VLVGSALAREYTAAEMSPDFRTNGNTRPRSDDWRRLAARNFTDYRLAVDGLVAMPQSFSLAELRAMPSRTQITRHDCVEGWSAIGQWTGVPLAAVLDRVRLSSNARFVVLHCADDFDGAPYYESIDLVDAFHPQTILAYGMNGGVLPIGHGAAAAPGRASARLQACQVHHGGRGGREPRGDRRRSRRLLGGRRQLRLVCRHLTRSAGRGAGQANPARVPRALC
jgi:hypothetical protein